MKIRLFVARCVSSAMSQTYVVVKTPAGDPIREEPPAKANLVAASRESSAGSSGASRTRDRFYKTPNFDNIHPQILGITLILVLPKCP
jgi:hypothetical protein